MSRGPSRDQVSLSNFGTLGGGRKIGWAPKGNATYKGPEGSGAASNFLATETSFQGGGPGSQIHTGTYPSAFLWKSQRRFEGRCPFFLDPEVLPMTEMDNWE